ncbi:hypothetical protein ACLB3A_06500 [Corynebacterium freneyi]|uniref:hypothetical protein n=1 Tax=Corynebacterium freneyi TaxID=134034 RepID=UPI00396CCAF0
MKRTIIAAAICGMTLSAVACAPSDSADGTDPSMASSVADSTPRPSHTGEAGSSTSATSQTPAESTSAEPTASAAPADQSAATGDDTRPATPTATRSADGRARIGDPCPGLEGTLRPAVNGENLICAGEPEPRWTVILDEPSPTETSPDPGDGTTEPGAPSQGDGPTTDPGTDGDGDGHHGPGGSSSHRPTPEPGRPTR